MHIRILVKHCQQINLKCWLQNKTCSRTKSSQFMVFLCTVKVTVKCQGYLKLKLQLKIP